MVDYIDALRRNWTGTLAPLSGGAGEVRQGLPPPQLFEK